MQHATNRACDATPCATPMQHMSLKALAAAVLARNAPYNSGATAVEKDATRSVQTSTELLRENARSAVANPLDQRLDALSDPGVEARRQEVLGLLATNGTAGFALLTDTRADPEAVLLTLAIRSKATCEIRIPRAKYDPFLLVDLIRRHSGIIRQGNTSPGDVL